MPCTNCFIKLHYGKGSVDSTSVCERKLRSLKKQLEGLASVTITVTEVPPHNTWCSREGALYTVHDDAEKIQRTAGSTLEAETSVAHD